MRVLILGGNGMLGHKLFQSWKGKFDVWATVRNFNSFTDGSELLDVDKIVEGVDCEKFITIEKAVEKIRPDVIINAIGIIKQISTAKNVVKTLMVNSIFPHQLENFTTSNQIRLINISTDCVFAGNKGNYKEDDISDAIDLYGKSKNFGEVLTADNCLTIRTSIIGRELLTKHSLVEWFLDQKGKKIKGYRNAIFSGFPTIIFADIIADLISNQSKLRGLYHISSQPISKFDLLMLLKKAYQFEIEIEPDEELNIDRSLDSTKFRRETGFKPASWESMIDKMVNDPFPYRENTK